MRDHVTFTKSNKILPPFPCVKIFGDVAPNPPTSIHFCKWITT